MNCVLEGNGVKVFAKALHALSRIGEELWLDPMVKGLALRSMNSAHSAYTCFLFSPLFFQQYSLGSGTEQGNQMIKCKLVMKSVLPLFRSLTSIERNVERCQISVSVPSDRVMIQFFCRHDTALQLRVVNTWWQCAADIPSAFVTGITKTHNLHYQESEALQAVAASHLCPNVLKAPARLLADTLMYFPVSQEEITLSATPMRISLTSNFDGENDHRSKMFTEVSFHQDEFEHFQVRLDSDITFCLKELRGFLSFAESHCLPVSVHFGSGGMPVCFFIEDVVLDATVVLATLIDSENRGPSQPTGTPPPTASRCADAAAPPAVPYQAGSREPQDVPVDMELIPSSQGSPTINSPALMPLLPRIEVPDGLRVPERACASAATTPASATICSFLFRALSSEQGGDGCDARLPVLACYSDTEEDGEEDYPRSPSL